jgi:PBP1b-binding outer membrane lipoprotein LpoB
MKIINASIILLFGIVFLGCCDCATKNTSEIGDTTKNPVNNNPTTVQTNKTVAMVNIVSLDVKSETQYSAKIEVDQIFVDDAYPSIAVEKSIYEVVPNFRIGENKEMLENDVNLELKNFSKKKPGDKVKVEFFLSDNKWILHRILN